MSFLEEVMPILPQGVCVERPMYLVQIPEPTDTNPEGVRVCTIPCWKYLKV